MNSIALATALVRAVAVFPLVLFFWQQSHFNGQNGNVGKIRNATVWMSFMLAVMFANLVYVNVITAINDPAGISELAQWVSLLTSLGFCWGSWNLYSVFRRLTK